MEHHTYAKSGSKKWSVEEKRLLVTKRIEAEDLFAKYSSKQAEPWKKFKDMAQIGDYSERALRKQWLNMVQRYRVQKSNMQVTPLNKQCIDVLNEEWEYFGEIHAYMTQRTTDLHSYALKEPNIDNVAMRGVVNDHNFGERSPGDAKRTVSAAAYKVINVEEQQSSAVSISDELAEQDEEMLALEKTFSSGSMINSKQVMYNSDIYTDSDTEVSSEPSDPVAVENSDLSEADSIEASHMLRQQAAAAATTAAGTTTTSNTESMCISIDEQVPPEACCWSNLATQTSTTTTPWTAGRPQKRKRAALSEREKYYRHRRRYEHRMELRLGGLCKVAGELLEQMVPGVNITPLLMDIYNNVDYNCHSSCDDDDDDDIEDGDHR